MKNPVKFAMEIFPCPFPHVSGVNNNVGLDFYEHPPLSEELKYYVFCRECGAKGPIADTARGAIKLWNLAHQPEKE